MAKRKSRGINGEGGISWDAKRKRHVARISIPNLDGTLRRPSASFKTKAEAEAWRRQAISERESGSTLAFEADELTVKEYIERWLEDSAKPSIAPNTYLKYEQEVRLRIIPHLGAVRLKALTPAHVEFFKLELLKTLKPSTVIQALQCLAAALNQAASWNLINESPTKKVKRPKIPKEEMICLTESTLR